MLMKRWYRAQSSSATPFILRSGSGVCMLPKLKSAAAPEGARLAPSTGPPIMRPASGAILGGSEGEGEGEGEGESEGESESESEG